MEKKKEKTKEKEAMIEKIENAVTVDTVHTHTHTMQFNR